ncbi:tetratricopeptide repeat protein [Paludisphaera rhizosphaerae]|uniref:tetratricopeptide repeat protein n=1 Tax=Paludisphaera rhizosphaerae TaxID=2711216 RepID=UPI0013EAE8B5|nr:hypothetical protein [Paludisphaera rhizosphaerae]
MTGDLEHGSELAARTALNIYMDFAREFSVDSALELLRKARSAGWHSIDNKVCQAICRLSSRFQAEDIDELELTLRDNMSDTTSLIVVLWVLFMNDSINSIHERRNRLITRIITEIPDHDIRELPLITPSMNDTEFWQECLSLWVAQVRVWRNNPAVLGNAAQFASFCDYNTSAEWFLQCKRVDPTNPAWPHQLGLLYLREQNRRGVPTDHEVLSAMAISELEQALSLSKHADDKPAVEIDLMTALFDNRRFAEARSHANSLIRECHINPDPWQRGLSVFNSNTILGLMSLAEGDAAKAKDHLLASVTPPDEQIYYFFPPRVFEMLLAKKLLKNGEFASVRSFLILCSKASDPDSSIFSKWIREIDQGLTPDLGSHLYKDSSG